MILSRKNPVYWMLWPCNKMLNWRPKSLCTISLGLVISLLVSLGAIVFWSVVGVSALYVVIILLFPILQFFIDYVTLGIEYEAPIVSFLLWFIIGAIFVGAIILNHIEQRNHEYMQRIHNGEPPLENNAVIEFLKVQKKKICPTVEYNDW